MSGRRPRMAAESPLATAWTDTLRARTDEKLEGCLFHDALAALWDFVGAANQPSTPSSPGSSRRRRRRATTAAARLRASWATWSRPAGWSALAVAPFMPGPHRGSWPSSGYAYAYGADGNGGPPLLDELAWGARAGEAGRVAAPSRSSRASRPSRDAEAGPGRVSRSSHVARP